MTRTTKQLLGDYQEERRHMTEAFGEIEQFFHVVTKMLARDPSNPMAKTCQQVAMSMQEIMVLLADPPDPYDPGDPKMTNHPQGCGHADPEDRMCANCVEALQAERDALLTACIKAAACFRRAIPWSARKPIDAAVAKYGNPDDL